MTLTPEQGFILGLDSGGFHRIAWYRWGAAAGTAQATVLCVHGLTRNGRDFDWLAKALVSRFPIEVVAVDMPGRGQSDWLSDATSYCYPQYMSDLTALIARLEPKRLFWVGTSMGGLLGLTLAAQSRTPIERLVLNDVGPFVPLAALRRISSYVGNGPSFATEAEFTAHIKELYAPFNVSDEQGWRHLALHSLRRTEGGRIVANYDPKIAAGFAALAGNLDFWPLWDRITCPTMVLRGESSDLLLADTAEEMTRRGPRAELIPCAGCGHAPSLMRTNEIDAIARFLAL
jgi:pimeloyl-ACP methyl ester carboxylesterase